MWCGWGRLAVCCGSMIPVPHTNSEICPDISVADNIWVACSGCGLQRCNSTNICSFSLIVINEWWWSWLGKTPSSFFFSPFIALCTVCSCLSLVWAFIQSVNHLFSEVDFYQKSPFDWYTFVVFTTSTGIFIFFSDYINVWCPPVTTWEKTNKQTKKT